MKTEGNTQVKDQVPAGADAANGLEDTDPSVSEPPATAASHPSENLVEAQTVTIKSADLEDLKADAANAKEYWDKLVRTAADFENFKKRSARERQDAVKYANEGLLDKLIPVIDTFEIALAASKDAPDQAVQSFQAGVTMIYQQLKRVLSDAGIEEIDATNQMFNPNLHEAVSQQETAAVPEGQVVQQLRKGYKLRERLIRPAGVVVAKAPGGN